MSRSFTCRAVLPSVVMLALTGAGPATTAAPHAPYPAEPRFNGPDFSGTYKCKGIDHRDGAFASTVALLLLKTQSTGRFGAYGVRREVAGLGAREGHMASDGTSAAMHLAPEGHASAERETSIVRFTRNGLNGAWQFARFYIEPERKGGNHGQESCTQLPARPTDNP